MQEKFSIFRDTDTLKQFKEFLRTKEVDGTHLAYDLQNDELIAVDKQNNPHYIDETDWRSRCNTIVKNFSRFSRLNIATNNNFVSDSDLIGSEYKILISSEVSALRRDLITGHKNKSNPLPVYDIFLEKWKKTEVPDISILDTQLWEFEDDPTGAGKILLRKLIREIILWRRGKIIPQMMDSYLLVGPAGIGKSTLGEKLCDPEEYNDQYQTLTADFTLKNRYDAYSLFRSAIVIELAEMAIASGDPKLAKDFMTAKKIDSRMAQGGMKKLTIDRKWIIYGTSNRKRCIPKELCGRRIIPLTIKNVHPSIGKTGIDVVNWLEANIAKLYAADLYLLDKENVAPDSFGSNGPDYPAYGPKLSKHQEEYQILTENEANINSLEDALDSTEIEDIRKYAMRFECFQYMMNVKNNKMLSQVLRDAGWDTKDIFPNGKKTTIWFSSNYVFGELSHKEQFKYLLTMKHIMGKKEIPVIENIDNEEDSDDGLRPEPKPNLPPTPPNRPIPGTELDLPESNAQEEDVREVLRSQYDNSLLGGENRIVEVNSKDKVCITPNLVKPGYKTNYDIGAIPDDQIVAAQYLFLDYDNGTIPEQWDNLMWLREYLPIRLIVFSGNKSLHAYIPLNKNITDMKYWTKLQEGLNQWLGSDQSIKNPGRLMQSPFEPNPKSDKMPISWIFDDLAVNPDELNWLLEFIPKTKDNKVRRKYKRPIGFKTKSPNEVENEITKLLNQIPESVSGSSTYNEFLPVIFSCNAVCDEYSVNKNWLENTLCSHSPNRSSEIKRAIKSANGSYTSGSFYHLMKEHGLR